MIDEVIGRRFPPMSLNKHAESANYGYSEKVPVAVGGGFSEGEHNVYRYLNALAGPQGQIIHYTRVGTCCAFKTPGARFDGTGLLEVYEVTYEGLPKPHRLYFNWYGAADPQIPVGLTTPHGPASEPPFWPCVANDGAPFGHLTESDLDTLISLAAANGLELVPTLKKVYTGDKEALATILRFSSRLQSLDTPTRVYGNMMYSIFLNLGEAKGTQFVIEVILSQEPMVRQRIRDFLWYPTFCVPKGERAEVERAIRAEFPLLWPPDFVFGKGDALFGKTPNNAQHLPGRTGRVHSRLPADKHPGGGTSEAW
jgi:hypothetical protein